MLLHPSLKRVSSRQLLEAIYSCKPDYSYYRFSDFVKKARPEDLSHMIISKSIRSNTIYTRVPWKAGYFADANGKLYTRQQIIKNQGILESEYKEDVYKEDYINVYKINERDAKRIRKYTTATVAKLNDYEYCLILFDSEKRYIVNRKYFKQS